MALNTVDKKSNVSKLNNSSDDSSISESMYDDIDALAQRACIKKKYANMPCMFVSSIPCSVTTCALAKCSRTSEYTGKDYFKLYASDMVKYKPSRYNVQDKLIVDKLSNNKSNDTPSYSVSSSTLKVTSTKSKNTRKKNSVVESVLTPDIKGIMNKDSEQ